jgi:hypothetical protein
MYFNQSYISLGAVKGNYVTDLYWAVIQNVPNDAE